jgi:hypothetical protein
MGDGQPFRVSGKWEPAVAAVGASGFDQNLLVLISVKLTNKVVIGVNGGEVYQFTVANLVGRHPKPSL